MLGIKALTFDTGGTILDWHTGISQILAKIGMQYGLKRDWEAITNDYRASSLKAMINAGTEAPATFNIDDVHRRQLDEMIVKYDLKAFTPEDRQAIWYAGCEGWSGIRCPGFFFNCRYCEAKRTVMGCRNFMRNDRHLQNPADSL